ncbi:MAG: DEAD/DEAH box helicase family protein [Campylobacterota bacterium]|nr:DEAD/DEAH box helicase family protein [Campylobacterota bacterium]
MKQLKRYQDKAISKLISRTHELFKENPDKATIIFQSPTGSGKTFMMSHYIEETIKEFPNDDICFLWISIGTGMLHQQSYYSLKKSFNGFPDVYLLENEFHGGRASIEKNEVVIVNWDKLNQRDKETGDWKNSLMKDSETYNFRDIVQNTRDLGTKIIMIIDESHTNANSQRALELRDEIIKADITIEMSATPVISQFDAIVKVNPQDVIDEGMIKKEIIVNDGLEIYKTDEITSQDLILTTAYSKRFDLTKLYEKNDLDINPLCLIQIPNGSESKEKQDSIEEFLAKNNITQENGKLAIWLSEDKINLDMLNDNESKVDFLIFKQAIATGWDCPRAHVLVKFRTKGSETLEIQTVGRILRMPEGEHYEDDNLNKAFLYIDTNEFNVKNEDYNPNIIKSIYSTRKEIYSDIKLKSYYLNRIDYGDITRNIYSDLEQVFCRFFDVKVGKYEFFDENKRIISEKITLEKSTLENEFILDEHLNTKEFDEFYKKTIKSNKNIKIKYSQSDYDKLILYIITKNLNGFAPVRSVSPVWMSIRKWFKLYLGIDPRFTENGLIKIRDIILSNSEVFEKLIKDVTHRYKSTKKKEIEKRVDEIEEWDESWEISYKRFFNEESYKKYEFKLSLYEPCYLKKKLDSKIELDFLEFLEKNKDKVLWWWQNGSEHMALNFGIKYNTKSTFQPDFIVMLKDGRLGIFDTKASGYQEDDNKLKGEALHQYIKEENSKGKKLFGGLVIKDGAHFRINQKEKYQSFKDSFEDWDYFEI